MQETLKSLQDNSLAKESDLFIFSDGAKDELSQKAVAAVRELAENVTGFKSVKYIFRDRNYGLAQSIITGVTEIVKQFGKVIVLEDDLVVSPYFLNYMNDGLELYQNDESVASIHGYAFPIKERMPETYFLHGADCWGWGTWKRAWDKFEPDGKKLEQLLKQKKLEKAFDFDGTQPNIQMLKDQIAGKNNSWAIRWNASAFVNNMLTLYPGKSLVRNIGLDNSGQHCAVTDIFDVNLSDTPIVIEPIAIEHSKNAYESYVRFFKKLQAPFHKRLARRVKKIFC